MSDDPSASAVAHEVERLARAEGFSGVVQVERGSRVELAAAFGLADRAHGVANTVGTRFGVASGTKALTALTVLSLVVDGVLALDAPARRWLGHDLALIPPDVTVEHLLGHRSGIGDYLDEDELDDVESFLPSVPVARLVSTEDYVAALDGYPTKFPAGEAFSYCNGGYVVLALIAERATGTPFHDLVAARVCGPAGMDRTAFLRSDELPGDVARGYLRATGGTRTNVFNLPARGSGDGGIHTTVGDAGRLWRALFAGWIVPEPVVAAMVRPRSTADDGRRYGLGFWLHPTSDVVFIEGCDAGVSFRSVHDPGRALTHTVVSNTTDGAWPVSRLLATALGTA